MLKSGFRIIRRILLAVAGGLGGFVVGGLLSLVLFHLKAAYSIEIDSLGIKSLLMLGVTVIAGILVPRFFMMFFLSPMSWLMDADASGGGESIRGFRRHLA